MIQGSGLRSRKYKIKHNSWSISDIVSGDPGSSGTWLVLIVADEMAAGLLGASSGTLFWDFLPWKLSLNPSQQF